MRVEWDIRLWYELGGCRNLLRCRLFLRTGGEDILEVPGTCTTRSCAPRKYVQNRENLHFLTFNNFRGY